MSARPHIATSTLLLLLLLVSLRSVAAQQTPPPPGCRAPEYRQFDFWLGDWVVVNPAGAPLGVNRITREAQGCALLEDWRSAQGGWGRSLNYFDPADSAWHQVWVGAGGAILHLRGTARDSIMEMEGPDRRTPNGMVRDRIRWTRLAADSVEQLWSISSDSGATWSVSFRGIYRRR